MWGLGGALLGYGRKPPPPLLTEGSFSSDLAKGGREFCMLPPLIQACWRSFSGLCVRLCVYVRVCLEGLAWERCWWNDWNEGQFHFEPFGGLVQGL